MDFKQALIAHINGEKVECMATAKIYQGDGSGPSPEWRSFGDFYADCRYATLLFECDESCQLRFRIKPRTVMCNGVEVPAPETVEPADDTQAWFAHPVGDELRGRLFWSGSSTQKELLARGLVYLREEDAVERAKAMLIT